MRLRAEEEDAQQDAVGGQHDGLTGRLLGEHDGGAAEQYQGEGDADDGSHWGASESTLRVGLGHQAAGRGGGHRSGDEEQSDDENDGPRRDAPAASGCTGQRRPGGRLPEVIGVTKCNRLNESVPHDERADDRCNDDRDTEPDEGRGRCRGPSSITRLEEAGEDERARQREGNEHERQNELGGLVADLNKDEHEQWRRWTIPSQGPPAG